MAYYKKSQKKVNGKWYPQGVIIGKPVQTKEVANRLADLSALSPGDCYSMLGNLGKVLGEFMNSGRTVKLDGVGTFYYTPNTAGQGVDTPEEVSAKQIIGTRVRFIPEVARSVGGQVTTRSLISENTFWEELEMEPSVPPSDEEEEEGGGNQQMG